MKKERRNPLQKEHFLEGNRQKWAAIFTAIGLLVMGMTAYGLIKDPAPFLGFFTGIGVTFILGASASAVMGAYKIGSDTTNTNVEETKNVNIRITDEQVIKKYSEKYSDDPSYRPILEEEQNLDTWR